MPLDYNEPAFPTKREALDPRVTGWTMREGMTLLDCFAGQALASRGTYGANVREKELAEECYTIAAAMLEARKKFLNPTPNQE